MTIAPFAAKNWQNDPATTTPINALALKDLETRLAAWSKAYADDIFNTFILPFAASNPDAMVDGSITYDGTTGLVETAEVTWPDGTTGVYTTLTVDTTFAIVLSYQITYGTTRIYTQDVMTLDGSGNVINRPAITWETV